jgi:uncharacterized protein YcbK (DUF882 family)
MVFLYKKKEGRQLSTNFNSNEFDCPCSNCKHTLIDIRMVEQLEIMRSVLGTKLVINSGFRCPDHQQELRLKGYETSIGPSTHELGQAADVTNGVALGIELEEAAVKAGFKAIGVASHWVHVDMRGPKERRWKYAKG